MRGRYWLLYVLLLTTITLVSAPALADEGDARTYPYVAYIAAETAKIHAGPGNAHYATDELARGTTVEVLREISGWLAIRPPVGSFSWVPAREAELTDEPDVAVILADDTPAWIGTRVDRDADHMWQVQLNQGDHVKVLDVKRRAAAGRGAESWYRIEPPEGELRFVRAEHVSRDEPAEPDADPAADDAGEDASDEPAPAELPRLAAKVAKPLKEASEPTAASAAGEDASEASPMPDAENDTDEKSVLKAQFVPRNGSQPRVAQPSMPSASQRATEKSSPFKEVGGAFGRDTTPRVASLERSPPVDPHLSLSASSRFEDKLTDLELQLSLMASRDPREWQLEPLRLQAEQLVIAGKTTLERGRARLVLDKIAQFDELYVKAVELRDLPQTAGVAALPESMVVSPATTPKVLSAPVKASALTVPDGVAYDGVGWLKPVYSAKRVAPPYALVDVDGKVLQYVTPAPGLNLNRYVKKPVGIFGQKSHLSEFNAAHLTAAKVVDLSKYQK